MTTWLVILPGFIGKPFFFTNLGARLHHLLLQTTGLYKVDIHQPVQSSPGTRQGPK